MSEPVKVRIAPSPTGDPHVGTAYVALFNYAYAKRHGGKFVLRIEDTDRTRSTLESEQAIMDSLRWLGLQWDEGPDVGGEYGPYRQSERGEIYATHAKQLVEQGDAYYCFCTPERLERLRTRQRLAKMPPGYDGKCRSLSKEEVSAKIAAGEPYVIRLKMPKEGETHLQDPIRGLVKIPNERSDDQVLLKSDGMPTYHLANVVDDHLMKITHVIRAEEWIPSTPKHLRLYEAFGWTPATFIHLPLLRNADKNKTKISKRKNPVSLEYYKEIGILPQALVNFLALMGWSYGEDQEKFSLSEMIEKFDLVEGSVSLSGPVFDLEKLSWLNSQYLHDLSDENFVDSLMDWRLNRDFLVKLAPLIRERVRKFDEFANITDYFFSGDLDYSHLENQLVAKGRTPAEMAKLLERLLDKLERISAWTEENLESAVKGFISDEEGLKNKDVFMPCRLIFTGRKASPPLFPSMALIGRERCLRRMRKATEFIKQIKPT